MVNTIILIVALGIIVQILLQVTHFQSEIEGQSNNSSYYHIMTLNFSSFGSWQIEDIQDTIFFQQIKEKGVYNVVFKKFDFH